MTEEMRNEIVQRWQQGASKRQIADEIGMSRRTVSRVLDRVEAERSGQMATLRLPAPPVRRASQLDEHEAFIRQLLQRFPDITAVRVYQELCGRGFDGSYSSVRLCLHELRPQPVKEPVVRYETPAAFQAQVDFSTYDIDFTDEGRRRVYLFSYLLSYSRRAYMRFVEAQDFTTTIREHVRAFHYLGGVVPQVLYDNMKVVVLKHDEDGPLFNPRFLAFATHYGFKPHACVPRRAKTKGKVEKNFHFAEINLLNGRTFRTLEHLNEVTAWWLQNVADVRILRDFKQRPIDRYAEERPQLLPLPAQPFDTALVVHAVVNVEGFVAYRQNFYSVPWKYLGQTLPVRITENEVIIYTPRVEEIARHRLIPRHLSGQRCEDKTHRPRDDSAEQRTLLRERFDELGPMARRLLDGLLRDQRYGKAQARKVLALLSSYTRRDWLAAVERAVRFGAYSAQAIERILAAQAKPRTALEALAEDAAEQTRRQRPDLFDESVPPRPLSEYQQLLENDDGPPQETEPPTREEQPPTDDAAGTA
jgi:transposase